MNRMHLSALITTLPLSFEEALQLVARLGFTHVDVGAMVERPASHLEALAASGLIVSCAAVGRDLPPGHSLDAPDLEHRRAALRAMERQVADAARLGAKHAYLVAGTEASAAGLTRFKEGCGL